MESQSEVQSYRRKFDGEVMRSVYNGMDVLGGTGKKAILYHIEARFGLREEEIPHHPRRFVAALTHIFGKQAQVIVEAILKEMRSNVRCDREFLRFAKTLQDAVSNGLDLPPSYLALGSNPFQNQEERGGSGLDSIGAHPS